MSWDAVLESYANLGWQGGGREIAVIAGIADIARDRKSKSYEGTEHGDTEKCQEHREIG
jgi:hypothetical protein